MLRLTQEEVENLNKLITGEVIKLAIKNFPKSRNRFGSVDRASVWELKGPGFDSGQGHVHWLRACPQRGVCRRQLVDVSSSLFLSLPLCIKYIFY